MAKSQLNEKIVLASVLLFTSQMSEAKSDIRQFQLYTKCLGVQLNIERMPDFAGRISLTREQIREVVVEKLRAAHLYVPRSLAVSEGGDYHPVLYVQTNISKTAFSLGFELRKVVLDDFSKQKEYAVTWRVGVLGVHGYRNQFILRMVAKYTDVFIEEWTRVNKPKCGEKEEGPIEPPVLIKGM